MSLLSALTGVLMVGHSLIGPHQPQMLDQMLAARGATAGVQAQIINGAPLIWNWNNGDTAEGVNARATLADGGIDTLILTEAVPLANHLRWSETPEHVAAYANLARDANAETRVFVLETWHSLNSGTGISVADDAGAGVAWRTRLDRDLAAWQSIVTDAAALTDAPVTLIPAGQAMGALSDAIDAGSVPGLRGIGDLFDDDIHPNHLGHYFVSLVIFAAITGEDPAGLPRALRDRWGGSYDAPDAALAARMTQIAARTVADLSNAPLDASATSALAAQATPPPAQAPPEALRQSLPTPNGNDAAGPGAPVDPRTRGLGMNLSGVNDWSVQQPFLDVMKTARPWLGHLPGQFGGRGIEDLEAEGLIDADGWPLRLPRSLSSIGTLILTDLPAAAVGMAGRYVLRFKGRGIVEVSGRVANVRYGDNTVSFDFTPGPGPVEIRIQRTDPGGDGDHVRDITVVKEPHVGAFDAGALFNPDWLALLEGVTVLRFMDWMATNGSTQSDWATRPRPKDATWARKGVPVEVMIALANTLGADPWFTLPHLADDAYVRRFAGTVRDGLNPDRRVLAEFSNEVWNWQFPQSRWADEQARARWGAPDTGMQFYGMRAAEVARIWSDVLPRDRLINVIATQTGWLGLEDPILTAPLFTAEDPANPPPFEAFDAYAITGYFGGILGAEAHVDTVRAWLGESRRRAEATADAEGLTGAAREAFLIAHRYDHAAALAGQDLLDGSVSGHPEAALPELTDRIWPYHKGVADRYGLELVIYEGGSHVVGLGPLIEDDAMTDFLTHFNYTPEIGVIYARLMAAWADLEVGVFAHFNDVYAPTRWGSWGARRYLSDDNPRWRALMAAK